ncbi:synaptonemal complex central element protein 2 [Orycteropus afer afer]|uniref:Synaptonemal complex central element protein 2 n=1 Tax=Orycteropus afer afer TaxID=1230840 RepID=A0A8B7AXG2_ORYAF|nr:synaptonemal complex central element protein 2 [Orycteropus afer afer]
MERQKVDMSHMETKDQEQQLLGDNKEQQQGEENHDNEAGLGPASANCQMILEGKSGSYFSSLDSSIEILKKRAQELIQNINESRQKDQAFMANFKDSLKVKVSDLTEKLEDRMYQIYSHHSKIIQEKVQEFTEKMAKISSLETELKQVCHTMETMYKDLCFQPEVGRLLGVWGPDCSGGKFPPHPSDPQPPDLLVSALSETASQVVTRHYPSEDTGSEGTEETLV